ncbi:MAG: type III pantothenate kinase [Planctomycetes bacterium]|nr:type III pantothenate kinase [Planctomycetota bacterium]
MDQSHVIAVSVGNTRTKVATFKHASQGRDVATLEAVANTDRAAIIKAVQDAAGELAETSIILVASVNDPVADPIERELKGMNFDQVMRVGKDLPVPIEIAVEQPASVGVDRLLNALGAYATLKQAVIVIDCGTATVVDFVDGEGTFQGGCIAPGAATMLKALHEHTAKLPSLQFAVPDVSRGPFGKDTAHAMQLGAAAAVRGMVHHLIDVYAEFYEAYPQVVATGGDAPALFARDELVEKVVTDLQLRGIKEAWNQAINDDEEDQGSRHGAERDDDEDDRDE